MAKIDRIHPGAWNKVKLKQVLKQASGKRILVVGDVGVDRYTSGLVERISPEAPVPIVTVQTEQLKLGLAANVADNVRALGAHAFLVGVVGADRSAQDFRELLKQAAIPSSHLVADRSRRTVLKERVVSDRQQLIRIDYENQEPIGSDIEKKLLSQVRRLISKVDAVILEDYAKGLLTHHFAQSVIAMAKRARKIIAVDPNGKTPARNYKGAFILTPNLKEAEQLSGVAIRDDASLFKAGFQLLKMCQTKYLAITLGKEGMAIFGSGKKTVHLIPTFAREVYDVSGAGDTVISVLTLALAAGADIEEASILGNLAAGVEVGKRGTATVSPKEIMTAMDFFGTLGI
jgi:rfaE bifunctional protein kinase chain/domain